MTSELPRLKAELPEHLFWLEHQVRSLVRPVAYLEPVKKAIAAVGATCFSVADVPAGGPSGMPYSAQQLCQSPYDGPSGWLQLDLSSIPEVVRPHLPAGLPLQGMVWLVIDLREDWKVETYHDPRPREDIAFQPRGPRTTVPEEIAFELDTSVPCADDNLPEVAYDYHQGEGLSVDYDEWVIEHYRDNRRRVQLGGWVWPCQGNSEERQPTFVLGFERQEFGDCGAVYLHFSEERGFFGFVECH